MDSTFLKKSQRESFTSIGDILKSHISKLNHKPLQKTVTLHQQWTQIAGPLLSQHSRVLYIKNGFLIIGVSHSTWHNELMMMKDQIIEQVQLAIPDTEIKGIKFKTINSII